MCAVVNGLASFVHHLHGGHAEKWRPLLSVYYLTYACPFRCPYCSDGAGVPYPHLKSRTLPAERALDLLRVIRRHCDHLVITGGEPLQHPEFEKVMEGLIGLKFRGVILTTNGYDLSPALPVVARSVQHLVVSLQTLDSRRADAWYGHGEGVHARVLENIDRAAHRPDRRYDIILSSVVTPENIEDLYAVYEFAQQRGFRLAACPQLVGVKAHPALTGHPGYRKFYNFLISETRQGGNIQGTVDYLEHMRDLRKFACRPFTMLVVSPAGDVFYPCLELGHFAGNLLESEDLHAIRQAGQRRFGPQPECGTQCHSACALGFSRVLEHPASLVHEAVLAVRSGLRTRFRAPPVVSFGSNRGG
jgi:MoaA/NifB/PqqE/SkfB family radical SAM enzyme